MRPQAEVASVLEAIGGDLAQLKLNAHQLATLRAIKNCRTQALGGHVDACTQCGVVQISYNSCRNRHCGKCQGHKKVAWIQARQSELLPVPYFHVVFTLPSELNVLAMHQPRLVYDSLFKAAWQTLQHFGNYRQLQMGMVSILHTWGQNLSLHPHLHCIVPGGGLTTQKRWKIISSDGRFLFSVKALSKVFRAKYVALLRSAGIKQPPLLESLFKKQWVVYTKRPFGNVDSVVEYLGRYTHKVAISNARIVSVVAGNVTFRYKDYKQGGRNKTMTLSCLEFVRRFAQHILPKGFVRIRHNGFLSTTCKYLHLKTVQAQFDYTPPKASSAISTTRLRCCTACKSPTPTMETLCTFNYRGPPQQYLRVTKVAACIQ
jgi:hypothetical protein